MECKAIQKTAALRGQNGSVNKFVFLEINGSFLVRIRI